MEINKPRTTHMDPLHKKSPGKPRTLQQTKPKASTPDSTPSPNRHRLTPKERSPKPLERRPARTSAPAQEKRNRTHDLESEHSRLLEDFKKVKEQLSSSELRRRLAQQEADDARAQLLSASGLPAGDPSDPAALSSAIDDLQKLKDEAETARTETLKLRDELGDTLIELARSREQVESLQSLVRRLEDPGGGDGAAKEAEAVVEKAAAEEQADLEAELRRLKVQSEQWRKAAEAATAMLSEEPPNSEEAEGWDAAGAVRGGEGSPKKRSENMLTRIGGIWKKSLK